MTPKVNLKTKTRRQAASTRSYRQNAGKISSMGFTPQFPRGGDCLFRSLGKFIGKNPTVLRNEIADFLIENRNKDLRGTGQKLKKLVFEHGGNDPTVLNFREYVDNYIRTDGWGGEGEIMAFVEKYGHTVTIKAIEGGGTFKITVEPFSREPTGCEITVTYDGAHYEAVSSRHCHHEPTETDDDTDIDSPSFFSFDENIENALSAIPKNSVLYRYLEDTRLQYWIVMDSTPETYTLGLLVSSVFSPSGLQAKLDQSQIFRLEKKVVDQNFSLYFDQDLHLTIEPFFPKNSVLYRSHEGYPQYWLVLDSTVNTYRLGLLRPTNNSQRDNTTPIQATLDNVHIFVMKREEVEQHFTLVTTLP
jgi:hypothetical protein